MHDDVPPDGGVGGGIVPQAIETAINRTTGSSGSKTFLYVQNIVVPPSENEF
jgi:hypothetical protein